jgi:chitodextrinase
MSRTRAAVAAAATALVLVCLVEPAFGSTQTISPNADAYVRQDIPNQKYGSVDRLAALTTGSQQRASYLRFTVPAPPSGEHLKDAKLNLTAIDPGASNPLELRALATPSQSTSWSESTITWANRPSWSAGVAATSNTNYAAGAPISLDATSITPAGGGSATFVLTASPIYLAVHSREATSALARPSLTLSYAASGDTTPPSAPANFNAGTIGQTSFGTSWTASTDNVGVDHYELFRDGASQGNVTGTSYTFTGLTCGKAYTFGVEAVDAAGNHSTRTTRSGTTSACSGGTPPVAVMNAGSQQQTGYPVEFDASDSHGASTYGVSDGIRNQSWDFGDGTPVQTGEYLTTVTHAFANPGTYTVRLTVTDANGQTATTTKTVTVGNLKVANVSGTTGSAIQSAINSLGGPGIVRLAAGTYSVTSQVSVPAGVIIEGAGQTSTRVNISTSVGFNVTGSNVRFHDLELAGPTGSNTAISNSATPSKNLLVDHANIHNLNYANEVKHGASATFEFDNIHDQDVSGAGYGILVNTGAYLMARNNEFSKNRHSIASGGGSGSNGDAEANTRYDFLHNHVSGDPVNKDVVLDMHVGGHGRLRLSDNTIENVTYAIGLKDSWGEIKRNTFRNVSGYVIHFRTPTSTATGQVIPEAGAYNYTVEGNTFTSTSSDQLSIENGSHAPFTVNCRSLSVPFGRSSITWNDCP